MTMVSDSQQANNQLFGFNKGFHDKFFSGFNPMWEETLVFTVHMPEIALIRFLVWDHDPIGQDFIGQRTIAFNSMMPGIFIIFFTRCSYLLLYIY